MRFLLDFKSIEKCSSTWVLIVFKLKIILWISGRRRGVIGRCWRFRGATERKSDFGTFKKKTQEYNVKSGSQDTEDNSVNIFNAQCPIVIVFGNAVGFKISVEFTHGRIFTFVGFRRVLRQCTTNGSCRVHEHFSLAETVQSDGFEKYLKTPANSSQIWPGGKVVLGRKRAAVGETNTFFGSVCRM